MLWVSQNVCALPFNDGAGKANSKEIILIAGTKSHDPGEHEYERTVRLIKVMLDHSGLRNIHTSYYLNGWPPADSLLDHADLILFVTDGIDGINFKSAPFMTDQRMAVIQRQVDRGCGIALLHFSLFTTHQWGQKFLEWAGGYYDWQDANGDKRTYSSLRMLNADITLPSLKHPISNGVRPFKLKEEVYYNMRFQDNGKRIIPILQVDSLGGRTPLGDVVAWAYQRRDGGRAFSATIGHFYSNWKDDNFRKVLINGLVWASGTKVPSNGVKARYYDDQEVAKYLDQH
ncbi:ThuA domain-containing protein [Mucilaginibacter daejeonensis]|uniref:ThuA domain-containing protein n=1 Tax=Mucilaginibacter daejeonensis TaxID=398049 RepID=UPI001D17282C|nr:ThuA domain-containing protein [Mucilaginibacter daejeonensis]UEG54823.1 ThuA domain-containing protein [Mucilaginibacter daejeonensis]